MYKPQSMTNQEWVRLIGADVNNLAHMKLTYGMAQWFLRQNNDKAHLNGFVRFSPEEEDMLLTAAVMHDWGESVVGDVTFDMKTDDHEEHEKQAVLKIAEELYPDNQAMQAYLRTIVDTVIFDSKSKLGVAFNAIERLGYMRTAMLVHRRAQSEELAHVRPNLQWMVSNYLANQIPRLIEFGHSYPAIDTFLHGQALTIQDAFETMSEDVFEYYTDGRADMQREKFQNARSIWQSSGYNNFQ
jgi:hypothetical protein